jgi:hypothetical protein
MREFDFVVRLVSNGGVSQMVRRQAVNLLSNQFDSDTSPSFRDRLTGRIPVSEAGDESSNLSLGASSLTIGINLLLARFSHRGRAARTLIVDQDYAS